MANKRTILVSGATGAQGGGVARHLLKSGKFDVRALTRNPNSDRAQALRAAGAQLAQGNLEDAASLRTAINGCHGVFGVTNFWEHFDREFQHGKNLIDAVAASPVEHFVFSSLPHAREISQGALAVPHFDLKARLEEYARRVKPGSTFVHVAFYYENFLTFFPPKDQGDGTFAFGFPQGDTPLAAVGVEDVGGVVAAIFDRPGEFRDNVIGVVGDDQPPAAYAGMLSRALGQKVVYNRIPREVFASFGFPGAEDLANMFEFNRLHIPNRAADLALSRRLFPGMRTFEAWLQTNKDKFRLERAAAAGSRS
ncbi:MAG: NmrA/HSCARG family protein [Acidobacteria bacterium]|nr:NmrA/HSCARG family protein [Acidobacteriota bacterium]